MLECLPMARALFGQEVEKALEELIHKFHIVFVSADMSVDDDGSDREFSRILRSDLSNAGSEAYPNRMDDAVNAQVKQVEDRLLPVLRL